MAVGMIRARSRDGVAGTHIVVEGTAGWARRAGQGVVVLLTAVLMIQVADRCAVAELRELEARERRLRVEWEAYAAVQRTFPVASDFDSAGQAGDGDGGADRGEAN
jgi:hypothetical protein